jgi:hypothetical protein
MDTADNTIHMGMANLHTYGTMEGFALVAVDKWAYHKSLDKGFFCLFWQ